VWFLRQSVHRLRVERRPPIVEPNIATLCPPQGHARIYRSQGRAGIRFNEHIEGDGPTVFAHACKMGLEGIVSQRKDGSGSCCYGSLVLELARVIGG
jgi:hypothetical protein